ncbi:MAG: hypothetical protein IJN72_00025 [Firmicutes bacterium]|nr:hypothetical protein [Bacillota bacterium]MBR1988948.1 hypothetical protein [Bacillota bacterium]MBR3707243.1 hypothetical protein [Bacillota bacterium]
MMKYRNKEYNKERNEMMRSAGLLGLVLAAAALGHLLVKTDSLLVGAVSLMAVLGALGLSSLRNIRA